MLRVLKANIIVQMAYYISIIFCILRNSFTELVTEWATKQAKNIT